MTLAARALLLGWGDPMAYLAHDETDFAIATAILTKAGELRQQDNRKKK